MKKSVKLLSFLMIVSVMLAGCAKKAAVSYGSAPASMSMQNSAADMWSGSAKSASANDIVKPVETTAKGEAPTQPDLTKELDTGRKVIKKASMDIQTKEFDKAVEYVSKRVEEARGFIQESNISGGKSYDSNYRSDRNASYVVRVPSDKLDWFIGGAESLGVVVNKRITGEDISSQYMDTEARVKTLKVQEERLLALLQKSGSLQDIVELEKRLSEVRYEIENLSGTLKKWDNLVELSTVELTIMEVQEQQVIKEKPATYGQKIAEAFKTSMKAIFDGSKALVLFLVGAFPFLVILAVLSFAGRLIYKRYKKNKNQ